MPATDAVIRPPPDIWAGLRDAAHRPVLRCLVNRDWHHRRLAVIGLSRGTPSGPAIAASVHVDLGCLGIRHAGLRAGPDGITRLLEDSGLQGVTWIDCAPALVARIIDAGADLGWINGAIESPRFRLVQRLFDPLDPDDGGPPVETGHPADGHPLYIPHPVDDGPAIVRHLTRVFGPTGFTVAGEPPLPEGSRFPFDPPPAEADDLALRAGVLTRRFLAWRTANPKLDAALDETVVRARQAGLTDPVAFAAAPWHARVGGRSAVLAFADAGRGVSARDRAMLGRWAEDGALRLLRLDAMTPTVTAWDPLGGVIRRLVTDSPSAQLGLTSLRPGTLIWAVARPLVDRWFIDRFVPVVGGESAAERALIAFESAVSSLEGPLILEDSLDISIERVPPNSTAPPIDDVTLRR